VSILEKIFFSRTSRPISIKRGTDHLCIKGIEVYTNKSLGTLQRGDNCKNAKLALFNFKIFILKNHKARKAQIYIKASWYSAKSNFKKIMVLEGSDGVTIGKNIFT
jgi:hypothetical protein